jgi:hypothetical protein
MKCPLCDRKHKNDGTYCRGCQIAIDRDKAEEHQRQNPNGKAVKFVHYQGHVVGFFGKNGKLAARYIGMSLSNIPKRKLINLDEYCPGFDRQQIKHLKATVLRLSQA